MSDRARPFSNGAECNFWLEHNCAQCSKAPADWGDYDPADCPIFNTISDGSILGDCDRALLERSGWTGRPYWDCMERQLPRAFSAAGLLEREGDQS